MPKKLQSRTSVLRIRVSPVERQAIEHAAAGVGLGLCTFGRMVVVKAVGLKPAPAPRRRPDSHAVALAGWTGALGRIGSNLNQLARDRNSGRAVDPLHLEALRAEVQKLRETILRFHASSEAEK